MKPWIVCLQCLLLCCALDAGEHVEQPHRVVLSLKPVGFWPLRGDGERISDLSATKNHGRAVNVPRDNRTGLLEFCNAFQYVEIPASKAYQTPSFSCGGWVFLRQKPVGGNWPGYMGVQVIGHQHWMQNEGAAVSVRYNAVPVATTGHQKDDHDALGNWQWVRGEKPRTGPGVLSLGVWQHVLFTYNHTNGRGVLYLNAKQIASRDKVVYKPKNLPLVAGSNAFWWHQTINGATGLNGSLCDLVWFDRSLTAAEATTLAKETVPARSPRMPDPDTVVVRTTWYALTSLAKQPVEVRREILDTLLTWEEAKLKAVSKELLQLLPAELAKAETRLLAVKLLKRIGSDAAQTRTESFVAALKDPKLTLTQRAEAALCLAEIGPVVAQQAKDALCATLEIVSRPLKGKVLKVENTLVNACVKALCQVVPKDREVRTLVDNILQPLRDATGNDEYYIQRVDYGFKRRDYISSMTYKGVEYKVGEGIAWKGVDKITPDQYEEIVERLPVKDRDAARRWAEGKGEHLYRVPLYRTTPDGKTQKVYLEGENFVLYGEDAKMHGWSLFADSKGYIHLVGGQHNTPNGELYIPGSWERLGFSRKRGSKNYPRQMYWVSKKPESIDAFEFVGGRDSSRAIPIDYLNYMIFRQSFAGDTYLYGRIDHYGWQSWGAFAYDAERQNWRVLGGDAYYVYQDALRANAQWASHAPRNNAGCVVKPLIRGGIGDKPTDARALAWSWNPAFYNFCRDQWGIRFDRSGRMHVRLNIFGVQEEAFYSHSGLYAYSDDKGRTFFRSDGSRVKLPLTSNPAPAHNANMARNRNGQWLELWLDVLRLAKVEPVASDGGWKHLR
jgi:hypothetical protein